jgi:hypothetical protein
MLWGQQMSYKNDLFYRVNRYFTVAAGYKFDLSGLNNDNIDLKI